MKNLKSKLQSEESVLVEKEFFVTLSKPCRHSHPISTSFMNQQQDENVKKGIRRFVQKRITHICTLKVMPAN